MASAGGADELDDDDDDDDAPCLSGRLSSSSRWVDAVAVAIRPLAPSSILIANY